MPRSDVSTPPGQVHVNLKLANLSATRTLAEMIYAASEPGDVIALSGPIGAGKTTLARFFIVAAGYQEDVPSPTFNLVQVYQGADVDVWHFDLYRLKQAKDVFELGIEQALEEAITLIEWPEKLAGLLPPESLSIHLDLGEKDNERTAGIEIAKNWAHRLDAEHIRQAVAGGGHD